MVSTAPGDERLGDLRGLRVLIVDDDEIFRVAHSAMLDSRGLHTVVVDSGVSALEAIAAGGVDLVLLDSRMPGMGGLEVLTRLRADGCRLPVLLVTGANELADRVQGLEQGADDYISKPVEPAEMLARIRAVLRNRRSAVEASVEEQAELERAARDEMLGMVERREFHAVFQPIVRLNDGEVVAYEALTRFDDGMRPDQRFDEAARLGVGLELELATLEAAIRSSSHLAEGAHVHLNMSPQILDHEQLGAVIAASPRPVVVEITEHDPIDDYDHVRSRLATFGPDVRLSIDDAGAGYASLTHILALSPDEVKLDLQWVRDVDTDIARQALVAGMVTFARATGTILVAEGVETTSELDVLKEIGVDLAQGYLLGRPSRVDE